MTVQAPTHAQWLNLLNLLHHGYVAMTLNASNSTPQMKVMVEVGIFRQVVDTNPLYRGVVCETLTDRNKSLLIKPDQAMAVHANLGWRNIGMAGFLHLVVTVSAIPPQIASVQITAVIKGLSRL